MCYQNDFLQNEHNHYENSHCENNRNVIYYEVYKTNKGGFTNGRFNRDSCSV